jgi:hypothetical protein
MFSNHIFQTTHVNWAWLSKEIHVEWVLVVYINFMQTNAHAKCPINYIDIILIISTSYPPYHQQINVSQLKIFLVLYTCYKYYFDDQIFVNPLPKSLIHWSKSFVSSKFFFGRFFFQNYKEWILLKFSIAQSRKEFKLNSKNMCQFYIRSQ